MITVCSKLKSPLKTTTFFAVIFFASGFSSLIYQVAWQRILTLHYGMGAVSTTIIVSVYMLGLGLGALIGGHLFDRTRNNVLTYFIVELLIGFLGLASLPMFDLLFSLTTGFGYFLSFFYVFLFLCGPTILMGATLPILAKIFNAYEGVFFTTISKLYFVNTLGAAAGSLFASYVLISFWGLDISVRVAATINILLALAILVFNARPQMFQKPLPLQPVVAAHERKEVWGAYLCVIVSGFLAVGYEIIWFRFIGVLVKSSPYAFSTILAVYLFGIAFGSWGVVKFLEKKPEIDKKNLFFSLQLLIGLYAGLLFSGYFYLTTYTSLGEATRISFSTELHPSLGIIAAGGLVKWFQLLDIVFWPLLFIWLPTVFMGASFPLISSLAGLGPGKEARTIGLVYFFNIVGNVLGGLVTGFILLHFLPVERILMLFASAGLLFGLFVVRTGRWQWPLLRRSMAILILLGGIWVFFPKAGQLYGIMHISPGEEFDTYLEEGIDGVVVTYENRGRVLNYINGLEHGGRIFPRWYYQTIEAMSHAPKVEEVLIVGYGTGSIAEMVLKSDEVRRVTVIEINGALIRNLKKMPFFANMLADGRVDLVLDDGRRSLLNSDKKYDLILIDPLRTTTAYSNNLYSREFFELAGRHLNEGGVFMAYMDEHRVMPKTVLAAFDYVRAYDFFCLASGRPLRLDAGRRERLYGAFMPRARERVAGSGRYLGGQEYIRELTGPYPINEDMKPVCEYYLGLAVREKLSWFN